MRVLEVGCGDGGNLLPLARRGCLVCGVDIADCRISNAKQFFQEESVEATFIASDVFLLTDMHHSFDLIICHDVIEHIEDKATFITLLCDFLVEDGKIFMSFPAWQMPFGGHQQICRSKFLSHAPFIHLLPKSLYASLLRTFGESEGLVAELLEIKHTKCPLELFEKILRNNDRLQIEDRRLYFINPHYKTKFGLTPRRLWGFIGAIPYVRNFFTTSSFYILKRY